MNKPILLINCMTVLINRKILIKKIAISICNKNPFVTIFICNLHQEPHVCLANRAFLQMRNYFFQGESSLQPTVFQNMGVASDGPGYQRSPSVTLCEPWGVRRARVFH